MGLLSRFRSWLVSVEFAVTATSVVVALAVGAFLFPRVPVERDASVVLILAGVAVPNVFIDSWMDAVDTRLAGVAWALTACAAAVVFYLLVSAGVRSVAGDPAGTITGFVLTWLLALVASRAVT